MSELNPKDNPRFYEVAHEFGLIVENEAHFTREERRDKALNERLFRELKREEDRCRCFESTLNHINNKYKPIKENDK